VGPDCRGLPPATRSAVVFGGRLADEKHSKRNRPPPHPTHFAQAQKPFLGVPKPAGGKARCTTGGVGKHLAPAISQHRAAGRWRRIHRLTRAASALPDVQSQHHCRGWTTGFERDARPGSRCMPPTPRGDRYVLRFKILTRAGASRVVPLDSRSSGTACRFLQRREPEKFYGTLRLRFAPHFETKRSENTGRNMARHPSPRIARVRTHEAPRIVVGFGQDRPDAISRAPAPRRPRSDWAPPRRDDHLIRFRVLSPALRPRPATLGSVVGQILRERAAIQGPLVGLDTIRKPSGTPVIGGRGGYPDHSGGAAAGGTRRLGCS